MDRALVALRPVVLLLPLFVYMLSSDLGTRNLIGYYQVALIGQHANRGTAKALTVDLFLATVLGSAVGLVMRWLMKLWPSLLWFILLIAMFSFAFASRIFDNGPRGLAPNYYRWSYGLSTLILIVLPDALTQGFTGDDPNMKFYLRIVDYALITLYSVFTVLAYDAIVDRVSALRKRFSRGVG